MGELLKERDDCIPNPEEWAVNTALNRHQLQANFTLVNSIKKLMDVQIQHILSYIVSQIDKNCNLDLLREVSNSSITKLWLSLFDDVKFLQFDYNAIATSSVPVTNLKRQNYCCKFPFSWEVIDQIEAAVGKSTRKCHLNEDKLKKTFTELLSTAANLTFYEHVEAVPLEDSQQLYQYYLHDYIRNLVLPFDETCMDSVYEILHKVINELVSTFEPAVLSQQPFPLINAIVGVHFAYGLMEKEVFWLAELSETFSELPNIVKEKELLSSGELIFHFEAVECVIDHLLPAKINWNDENMKNWILDFHSSKSAVESLLYLKGHNDASNKMLTKARSNWQKVVAVALLIEHVISQIPPDLAMSTDKFTFLRRYNNLLKNIKFSDPKILVQTIKQFQGIMKSFPVKHQPQCQICESYLNMKDVEYIPCNKSHMFCKSCFQISFEKRGPRCPCCDTPIPQEKEFPIPEKKRKEYELLKQVQQHCLDFFMELVSQCCFSQIAPEKPTDAFFKKLLDIVTDTEHEDYESLFPYEEDYVHSCPLVRSVLLQLLLEYDPQQVKMKLQESLAPIKEKHGNAYASDDQELTLLLIKSLEDGLHKENVMKTALNDQLHFANECLVNALNVFIDGDLVDKYQKSTSIEFMQCIAQVRFGMYFAAKMFFEYYCNPDQRKKLPRATEENLKKLRSNAQNLVEKGVLKEPKSFLMKQIVRQYGLPYLYKLGDLAEFQWFAPKLKDTDYFVIIGKEYTALRANWIFSKSGYKKSELLSELKSMSELKQVIVVLVLFKKFTADRTVTKVAEPGQKELTHFYKNLWLELDQENLSSLQVLNLNQKSEKLSKIIFTPWEPSTEKALAEIVIHFAAVLGALSHDKLLTPFVTILTQTAKSKEMYWPTMPDDILDVIVDATKDSKDTWWKCPNGHDYFIQNCGRPVVGEVKYCFCGAPIGGRGHHKPMEDNIKVSDKPFQCDRLTKYGHCFDPPDLQATDPIPERELSPLSNCIMRLLLHAVCVWVASSNDKAACEELSEVVIQNEPVPPEQILNFFWHHLEKDLQTLTRVTQQSFDDCVLFIHILIHKMLSVKHDIDIDTFLTSREARKNFEIYFDSIFIKPITKDIHDQIKNGRLCITADLEEDERTMMQMIYETLPITSTNIIPHLWIYRPQITIDHLAQSLQLDTTDRGLRILQEFLAKVTLLSALQYLPDIVQLQTSLYEICHHRIHQNDAKISLENFIKNYIPKGHDDQRSKFTKWAESFCSAWNIVRGELTPTLMDPNVTVTQEHMTIKQPLGYFLPMKQGEGACSIALAKYLARLQNDFIDLSWEKLKLKSISGKHEVPLSKIQHCQMISFEHQLSHVIFSHCKYSLKAGHGADVTYDYVALEKHILDRFVRGKPLIFCDIPIMSYYSDVLEALTFTKIRKTIPQLPLPQREKDNILYEMTRKHCLQSCIDIVNIALGFVQYCNWNPDIMMKRYMYTLRMDRKLPATIEEHCQLAHIISLWRILNVEQARKITRSKEDPFPGINEVFKQELTKEETETLKTALGPFDMDQFLEILYEFIVTQVKNRQEIEAEDSLIDSYIDACDYFHLEKIANFEEKFPKQFSLQHVTEIWKYAVKYKEDQQNK